MSVFGAIVSREPIDRGWSADRKYKVMTAEGKRYYLRISPMEQLQNRKLQFSHMEQVRDLGIRVCEPVEFGVCDEDCYTLLGWVDGKDAEPVLPGLSGQKRYALGMEAGEMLRAIHGLPAPFAAAPWAERWGRKLDTKLAAYEACPLKYEKGELYLDLLRRERHLVEDRPTVWQHGDFHCGNLMLDEALRLWVIDFDREDIGDPWYEFNRIIWDVRVGAEYACGMVDGYFGGAVPEEFWRLLRLYQCQNMISSLPWALDFGEEEIKIARENADRVLSWYDDLKEVVPNWYKKYKKHVI